ncbi:hypothetical protein MPH_00192 [Macrophomina phaseolina MS6]|uniref:Uncharacterized protein n=1 Tax=Macrophomina phaseolina (strain MS6) TaxID=1126212 RepID=K2SC03_MACPH|nr:hypothetical protein MPH_00192 [Macrophomina phaseolina MS6]
MDLSDRNLTRLLRNRYPTVAPRKLIIFMFPNMASTPEESSALPKRPRDSPKTKSAMISKVAQLYSLTASCAGSDFFANRSLVLTSMYTFFLVISSYSRKAFSLKLFEKILWSRLCSSVLLVVSML